MRKVLKRWTIAVLAVAALALFFAALLPVTRVAQAQNASAPVKNLYEDTPKSFTSANNPTDPWFAKPATIELGDASLGNSGMYYNAVQVLAQKTGEEMPWSEIVYDISAYDYDFFTVTVGNRAKGGDGFSNEITYQVWADDAMLTQTSHPLVAYEIERLACKIPDGAQELRLKAVCNVNNTAYSECNWASPVLSYETENTMTQLSAVPVSGNNTETGQEEYKIGSAVLNNGAGGTITDENAITGAIHGDYGNNTWKFSADYDISGANYTRLTMDVGMLFNETENKVVFSVRAIGGVSADLAVSPAMDGTTYHHFDVAIPAGTTKIQIWAQSQSNTKAYGNLALCNATLYAGSKETPAVYGSVTCTETELAFGDPLPALQGEFRVNGATVPGTVALDSDQTLQVGTFEYDWTFTATAADCYQQVKGKISLEVARGNGYISPSDDEADFVLERGGADVVFPLLTLPETMELKLDGQIVSAENYRLESEGALVLSAAYLETLPAGDHVFTAVCENGDFTVTVHVKTIEQAQPAQLNLYNEQYTSITSQHYPADEEYFSKLASIQLGRGDTAAEYANVLQLLVNGPFADQDPELGTYFSALTYDISMYRYNYFSVTVGNANAQVDSDGEVVAGNNILYQVMIDGEVVAQTTHYLAPFETQLLTCSIPAGAQEIRLHAQSESGLAYGECNWANPVLSVFKTEEAAQALLKDMTASGLETDERFSIGPATLNDGMGGTITDQNAITGAINGDYGNNTWKFSADFDISDKNYNRLTMDVGMLNNETQNKVVFTVRSIGGLVKTDLAVSPALDGTSSYHFDVTIPAGTTKIQIWVQSQSNMKEYGDLAICNATLYAGGKTTPVLTGQVESVTEDLQWGDKLPELRGDFTVGKAVIQGTLALDAGQTIAIGTHTYNWTFTPSDGNAWNVVKGTIELTAGKQVIDLSGVSVSDASFVYDGKEHSLSVTGSVPEFVTVTFNGNARTAVGTTEVIVSFVLDAEYADLYEAIPSRTAQLTITPATFISAQDAEKAYTLASGEDVSFTLQLDAVNAVVSLNGTALGADDVTVNGKTVTFSAAYLDTLGEGEHTFTVSTDGGEFTLTVTVAAAPASNGLTIGLTVAGVVIIVAAIVVAFVLTRKKKSANN